MTRALLVLLLACGRGSTDSPPPTGDSDTGTPTGEPQGCAWLPCVTEHAEASATGEVLAGRFGQEIAVLDGPDPVVVVGGPADPFGAYDSVFGEAVELGLPGLGRGSVWATDTAWDAATYAMAIRVDPSGGYVLAVGADGAHGTAGRPGAVYLLRDDVPDGSTIQEAAHATISGDGAGFSAGGQILLGLELQWLDLGGGGTPHLVVSAPGTTPLPGDTIPDGAAVYAFDSEIEGTRDVFDASWKITSPVAGFALSTTGWDGDLDGIANLVASQEFEDGSDDRVLVFESPWTNDGTVDDAVAVWTLGTHNAVDRVVELGDVTGDGAPDLFTGAATWSEGGFSRAGAAWVLAGGDLTGGSMLDAPIHLYGDEVGEGVGSDATSGDFDGDGLLDLAIGCYGLTPAALPGKVVVFRGPVSDGALDESLADAVIYGEYPFDQFGMNLEALDIEADGLAELLVGAPGADTDVGRVYLLRGDALVP